VSAAGDGMSLIVPFRPDDAGRSEAWSWLERYWRWSLPGAELIVADDDGTAFSKTCAVNAAAAQAGGDVYVIMDADAYLSAATLVACAEDVRGRRAWWMPYKAMWRLRRDPTRKLLAGNPKETMKLSLPPHYSDVQGGEEAWVWSHAARTHGALCQVVPAAGFWEVGGMDERFRGWGGEDSSFAFALDTLWAPRSMNDAVDAAHLWHARIGEGQGPKARMWAGQKAPRSGSLLRGRYAHCNGKPGAMRKLVNEGLTHTRRKQLSSGEACEVDECNCAFPEDSTAYTIWLCRKCKRFYQLRPAGRFFHQQWHRMFKWRAIRALRHSLENDLSIQGESGFKKAFPLSHPKDFKCSRPGCTERHVIY
jgi:hypothetical protein